MNFHILLVKDIKEQIRTHRLLAMVLVFLTFSGFFSPIVAKFAPVIVKEMVERSGQKISINIPEPTISDSLAQFLKNTTQIGIIVLILIAMGSVALERERGTAAATLSKPVSRLSFLLAKFLALTLTVLGSFVLSSIVFYFYTVFLFGHLSPFCFLSSALLVFLYLWIWTSLTFLFSTIFVSQIAAGGMAFGLYLFSSLVGALPYIKDYMPAALIRGAGAIALGAHADMVRAVALGLAIISISFLASYEVFKRKEM